MKSLRARRSRRYIVLALASFPVILGILSLFVMWRAPTEGVESQRGAREAHARWIGLPSVQAASLSQWGYMCVSVMTGTYTSTWVISNPNGLGTIADYHAVNFDQEVLSRSATSARVQIVSRAYFDTNAPFPINASMLPPDIRPYLQPSPNQQSDNPLIRAQAQALVVGVQTEVQAVNEILDWVLANIRYGGGGQDAVSVYENRYGICMGFSNLAVALLRAVGVPARDRGVCAFPGQGKYGHYAVGPEGGGHAVIETFYPDAGWVPSEPQGEENFINTFVWFDIFDGCGRAGTTFTEASYADAWEWLYGLARPHPSGGGGCASVSSWDRDPLHVSPSQLELVLSPDETSVSTLIEVDNTEACDPTWRVESDVPWITLSPSEGIFKAPVTVTINAASLEWGHSLGTITVSDRTYYSPNQHAVPVRVWRPTPTPTPTPTATPTPTPTPTPTATPTATPVGPWVNWAKPDAPMFAAPGGSTADVVYGNVSVPAAFTTTLTGAAVFVDGSQLLTDTVTTAGGSYRLTLYPQSSAVSGDTFGVDVALSDLRLSGSGMVPWQFYLPLMWKE